MSEEAAQPSEPPAEVQVVMLDDRVEDDDDEWEDIEDDDEGGEGGEEQSSSGPPKWVPHKERPEWADIQPIPQNDGPFDVVRISYTDEFRDTMDYFRAIMKAKEKSPRALALAAEVVRLNPSNYVGWWYRRQCLYALQLDLVQELDWMQSQLLACPKNYQVWFHRRDLLTHMPAPNVAKEKRLINRALADDSKNYHSWCHRRWLVQHFNAYYGEVQWVSRLIEADVRNNSAWNYRYFLMECNHLPRLEPEARQAALQEEFEETAAWIRQVPNNETPYNYLMGLTQLIGGRPLACYLKDVIALLIEVSNDHPDCSISRSTLLQSLEKAAEVAAGVPNLDPSLAAYLGTKAENFQQGLRIAKELQELDGIRGKYWRFQQRRLEEELKRL